MEEEGLQSERKPPSTKSAALTAEPLFRVLGLLLPLPLSLLIDLPLPLPLPLPLLLPPPMFASSGEQLQSVVFMERALCFNGGSAAKGED